MRPDLSDLTDLQLRILGALWTLGKGTIAGIHSTIGNEQEVTVKTIGTLLGRMEKRGLVAREMSGREGVYTPLVTRRAVIVARIGGALSAVFATESSGTAAVSRKQLREGDDKKLRALLRLAEKDLKK